MQYKYLFFILFTTLLLSSCIIPYDPNGIKETAGILAVEGIILETGTTIKLSRTVSIYNTSEEESQTGMEDLLNARVHVIDDMNNIVAVAEQELIDGKINPGVYVTNTNFTFTPGKKYALTIQVGGKQYQSSFVSPINTPEIDEINWRFKADKSMDIMVSTHDPENKIDYFCWTFEEDWEIISSLFGTHRYEPTTKEVIEQSLFTAENRYYCWASDKSKSILVGSSDKLTESTIKNKVIHNFPPNNSRFSFLYSILVKQYAFDKEAYTYFETIRKNTEQSGSIFAPMFSVLKGNITCLSNPDEPVIGYIFASKEVASRIFIDMERIEGEDRYDCIRNENGEYLANKTYSRAELVNLVGHLGIHYADGDRYHCSNIRCVDCTYRGGTKNKPDFWPNDHL